jgi:hypothetical protein
LTLCAVLCGADGWVSVALFGEQKLGFLRRYLPFANGTPSHDQLGLIFGALDAAAFQNCFIAWTQSLSGAIAGVDGQSIRTIPASLRETSRLPPALIGTGCGSGWKA